MINIDGLRRLAQAATPGPWGNTDTDPTVINSPYNQLAICYRNSRAITDAKFIAAANPAAVSELLDRLEAAEQTAQDYLRIDGEKAQIAQRLEAAEKERNVLKAKVERMEKRLRLILEEPENTMSNSKAMREILKQARLALEKSK